MEIFKLTSDFYPGESVTDYATFIWTERYQSPGDFQIIAKNDISLLYLLPVDSLISHTDTLSVCIVENYSLMRDEAEDLVLTIYGRSLDSFSENRVTQGSKQPLTDSITGEAIVETILSSTTSEIIEVLLKYSFEDGSADPDDVISNVLVERNIIIDDDPYDYVVRRGDVYSRVSELLQTVGFGVKITRPMGVQTTLNFVIYDGVDRTETVSFNSQTEDLENVSYLGSNRNSKNYVYVATNIANRLVEDNKLTSSKTGLSRRIAYLEIPELEDAFDPPSNTDYVAILGQNNLDNANTIDILQAQISEQATPKFKIHYDIGDLVRVSGEFSTQTTRRVTEHVLTVDDDGIRGYPALSAP